MKSFSPTFPEQFNLVEESRRLDAKVLLECPLHSTREAAGRLYESTRGHPLEVLSNADTKEDIVTPMLSAIQKGKGRNKARNAAIISLFYFSGLRISEIADLRYGDVDLRTGTINFDKTEK
jgi:integrase